MKKKKICLRGLSDILSERELKNVLGGSGSQPNGCNEPTAYTCSGNCTTDILTFGICKFITTPIGRLCACVEN
jgi:natural product precursor